MFDFAAKYPDGLPYADFLKRYGSNEYRRRWACVYDQVHLNEEQRKILSGFVREMKVLCLAGAWCPESVNQCPIFERFVEVAPKIKIHYFDRDENQDLMQALQICGGNRIPVVVFLSEDDKFCGIYGERTLAEYKQMAIDHVEPSCPSGIVPQSQNLLDAITQEWLHEFQRVQLMLRLSSRLRQLHGD